MLLAIDLGNTRIKAAVFEEDKILQVYSDQEANAAVIISKVLSEYPLISDIIYVSVTNDIPITIFPSHVKVHRFGREWVLPLTNLYQTPETLGVDRLVLSAGAVLKFGSCDRLVIDAGSCITYDYIDQKDSYHGGAISPGLGMRYSALSHFTAKLPFLHLESPHEYTGKTTAGSIHSGVVNGVVHEIEGFISHYKAGRTNFSIILTGGDTEFLEGRLNYTIFANSNFLLESLNLIFQYKRLK